MYKGHIICSSLKGCQGSENAKLPNEDAMKHEIGETKSILCINTELLATMERCLEYTSDDVTSKQNPMDPFRNYAIFQWRPTGAAMCRDE